MTLDYILIAPQNDGVKEAMQRGIMLESGQGRLLEKEFAQREFSDYYWEVLRPQLDKGTIKPRDLKLRFSDMYIGSDCLLVIQAGPTSFQEYRAVFQGDVPDLEGIARLKGEGKASGVIEGEWARLARPIGVTAVVRDSTGRFVVGKRTNVTEYLGEFQSAAGYLQFDHHPERADVVAAARAVASLDYNIKNSQITHISAVAIAAHPATGETDIAFLVDTSLGEEHFGKDGLWKQAKKSSKYESLLMLNAGEARAFLQKERVVYPTAAVLDLVLPR